MCAESLIAQAQSHSGLDIEKLLLALSQIKLKRYPKSRGVITEVEKTYLYLCLSGYSKGTIAYQIRKYKFPTEQELNEWAEIKTSTKYLDAQMADSIHFYIKQLLGIANPSARIPAWKTVIEQLKLKGYGLKSENTIELSIEPNSIRLITDENLTSDRLIEILTNSGFNVTISQVIES